MKSLKDKLSKENKALIFIIVYCVLLFAVLIGINAADFLLNKDPLELIGYTQTPEPSHQLLININTADLQQLCQLPQIGEKTAQRIIEYREQYGRFYDISRITDVEGIGGTTFEKIRDLITVD